MTPISGSTVSTPHDEAEAERRRQVEQPARQADTTPLRIDWPITMRRYRRPRVAASLPDAPDAVAPRRRELVGEAVEVAPPVGEQEQHQDPGHDVRRRRAEGLGHGALADPRVEVVDEVTDPLAGDVDPPSQCASCSDRPRPARSP